jgi:hypothetical protein
VFPHDQLAHYDGDGVFCQECDEFIQEEGEDEEEAPK